MKYVYKLFNAISNMTSKNDCKKKISSNVSTHNPRRNGGLNAENNVGISVGKESEISPTKQVIRDFMRIVTDKKDITSKMTLKTIA